ncbi:hypothetical protein LX92_04149 [Maribacter polysiphoniae]|uniref:Uncharacterized protein n=2 Tax=Maribacter polysiphoniae TaxID=429344 RepID=A0A316DQV7_9FLAO|nr:hypothetical protein LX92_04149 [Maribacter polysiphoniae]
MAKKSYQLLKKYYECVNTYINFTFSSFFVIVLNTNHYTMNYLSPQIEALSKKKIKQEAPLVKKVYSCGIFQEYDNDSQVGTKKHF